MKWLMLPLCIAALLVSAAAAQDPPDNPEFDNAPVTSVLLWAQRSIGCGFIYEAETLRDPATGRARTITASHIQPQSKGERTLLLFELLRRCHLVAFEAGGLPGPTYQLYDAAGAARAAPLLNHPDELGAQVYAALTIRLRRSAALEVAARLKPRLSEGISSVEVFENTHALIVADYAPRLRAAWEVARAADEASDRVDDNIVRDFALRNAPADRALPALERLRDRDETWRVAAHQTANVLLFSGRRDELDRIAERVRLLDRHEERPDYAETTRKLKVTYIEAAAAARTLKEMFAGELKASSVLVGSFGRDIVVFRGSEYDYRRAADALRLLDVQPAEKK